MTGGTLIFQVIIPTLSLGLLVWILIEIRGLRHDR